MKNAAASALGRRSWASLTPAQRKAKIAKMNTARKAQIVAGKAATQAKA